MPLPRALLASAVGLAVVGASLSVAASSPAAAGPSRRATTAAAGAEVPPATVVPAATGIVGSVRPERLYDSRSGAPLAPREDRHLCESLASVPDDATAVVLNLTVVSPTAYGYLAAWPANTDAPPSVSALNFAPGTVTSNLAVLPVGAAGCFTLHNGSGGTAHVVVDVQGYLTPGPATAPGSTQTTYASRILDTRTRRVAIPARGSVDVQVAGRGGIPATDVGAAWLNLTVTGNAAAGFLTAYPAGTPRPTAANLSFGAGETRAAMTLAKLGSSGRVTVYNGSSRPTHLVVDASGFVRGGDGGGTLAGLTPVAPTRALDTRPGSPLLRGATVDVPTPAKPAGASGVVLAVTAVGATQPGYLSVGNNRQGQNATSMVNFVPGRATTNLVLARLDSWPVVRNGSAQPVDVVVDVVGWVNAERAVAGRVTSTDGTPVGGARVYGYQSMGYALGRSADDGTYGVPLPASMTQVTPCAQAVTSMGTPSPDLAPGCHPQWVRPTVHDLGVGQLLSGADIPLEPAGVLRGTARDTTGAPLTYGQVTAVRAGDARRFTGTVANGQWAVAGVAAGDYYLSLASPRSDTTTAFGLAGEWYPDVQAELGATPAAMTAAGAQTVAVAARTSTTVDLVAEPLVKVSGTVSNADGTPLQGQVGLKLRRANGSVFLSTSTRPTPPGAWTVYLHPGTVTACSYRSTTAPEHCWQGDVPVDQATPITLTGEQDRTGIDIALP
jgi:hypothetical protein